MNVVHKEEFLDLKAETGTLLSQINELNVFKTSTSGSLTDDHYKLIKTEHDTQENTINIGQQHLEIQ